MDSGALNPVEVMAAGAMEAGAVGAMAAGAVTEAGAVGLGRVLRTAADVQVHAVRVHAVLQVVRVRLTFRDTAARITNALRISPANAIEAVPILVI